LHKSDKLAYRDFMSQLQRQANMGLDIPQILRIQLLNRARSLDFYGKICAFFSLSLCMTVFNGLYGIYLLNTEEELKLRLDLFTYALPFICLVMDIGIKRAFLISAKFIFFLLKLVLIVYYLIVYVIDLQHTEERLYF
jgi:hypothetical protein